MVGSYHRADVFRGAKYLRRRFYYVRFVGNYYAEDFGAYAGKRIRKLHTPFKVRFLGIQSDYFAVRRDGTDNAFKHSRSVALIKNNRASAFFRISGSGDKIKFLRNKLFFHSRTRDILR